MIILINTVTYGTNTGALPSGIAVGDFILVYAFRNAITAPTLAAGFTNIANASGNSNALRVAGRFATGADATGTWTNASQIHILVYRGVAAVGASAATTHGSSLINTLPALTLQNLTGNAFVFGGAQSIQITSMSTPADMTQRTSRAGATAMVQTYDTATGVPSWAGHDTNNGTAAVGGAASVELIPVNNNVLAFM